MRKMDNSVMNSSDTESRPNGNIFARLQKPIWAIILLFVVTILIFQPACSYDFVNYDDNLYVAENQQVQRGLSVDGIVYAFTQQCAGNYHPLTMLSHMIDGQLFGKNPAGHHTMNVLFHAINSALLFFVLLRLSKAFWQSFVVTAIVQWHPLRVESVAWIAERKDVLSLFFALLTIYFYALYAKGADVASASGPKLKHGKRNMCLSLLFFACGLMSKPMLVTLPFILLLLDLWPLGRIENSGWQNAKARLLVLVREKQWFFLLVIPAVITTIWAQGSAGAIETDQDFPLSLRLQNAPVAIVKYLGKIFWPTDLAVLYPYPLSFPVLSVLGAVVIVMLITVAVFGLYRRFPFLLVGWLWFLGALVPVLNVVQAGIQGMADRYSYLPSIGLLIATVWLCGRILPRKISVVMSLVAVIGCISVTRHQLPFWKNGLSLFERAADVTEYNYIAHYKVGDMLLAAGDGSGALAHYREVIRINPGSPQPRNNYAKTLAQLGRNEEAIREFATLIREHPTYAKGYSNFGAVLGALGKTNEAEYSLSEALRLDPKDAEAHVNLANLYFRQAKTNDALAHYSTAIRLNPREVTSHFWSARLLLNSRPEEAVEHLLEVIRLRPESVSALNELGWILATHPSSKIRNGLLAVQLATRSCELTKYQDPQSLAVLEVAYSEQGRFDDAIALAEKELEFQKQTGNAEKIDPIQRRIVLYRSGKPFHQP